MRFGVMSSIIITSCSGTDCLYCLCLYFLHIPYVICFLNSLSLSLSRSLSLSFSNLSSCISILCLCITPQRKNHPIFDFRFGSIFLPMFLSLFSYSLCFLACASPFSQRMRVACGRQCSHLIRPFTPTTFVRPNAYPSRLACCTFLPGLQ